MKLLSRLILSAALVPAVLLAAVLELRGATVTGFEKEWAELLGKAQKKGEVVAALRVSELKRPNPRALTAMALSSCFNLFHAAQSLDHDRLGVSR